MGPKRTSSATSTDTSTKVTTNTTTTVGDIGLTGDDALDLVRIVEQGVQGQTIALGQALSPIIDSIGTGFDRFSRSAEIAADAGSTARVLEAEAKQTPLQLVGKNAPLIVAAVGAILVIREMAK